VCRRFDAGRCFFLTFLFKLKNVCIFSYFCVLLLTERGDFGHLQTFRDDYYIRVCCALNIYFPFPSSLYYLISAHGKFFFFFSISFRPFSKFCSFLLVFFCFFVFLFYWSRLSASLPVHRRRIFRSFFYFII
jgi:hypothetical protein